MTEDEDILHQFKTINNKLKKKFMRRTNLNEPIEQFTVLANNCEKNELPQYAGLCLSAIVNCELSRKNYVDAAFASIKAGDQFVRAHRDANELGCYSPSDEYLQAALNSYTRSRTFYKNSPLEESLNWKTVSATSHVLDEDRRPEESLSWLRSKVEIRQNDVPYLEKVVSRMIKIKDYTGALDVCSKIIDAVYQLCGPRPFGVHVDILRKYEITIILLLLILKPNPRKLSTTFSNMLEKYTWIEDSFNSSSESILPEKLFFLVQSLVMNCHINNSENIRSVEKELIRYLDAEQIDLLRMLINSFE